MAWSTLGVYIRILGQHFDIFQQVYLRVTMAAILVAMIGIRRIGWSTLLQRMTIQEWRLIVLRTCAMYVLGVSLASVAFIGGEYSTISLIKALPLTAMIGVIIFREKLTQAKLLFVLLAFMGASLLVMPDLLASQPGERLNFGYFELVGFISAACLAFSNAARKWQRASINNWESTFLMFIVGIPILFIASLVSGETPLIVDKLMVPEVLFAIGMSGLLNAVGLVVINYALGHIEIVLSNNIFALQPVFGVVVGVLLYQDVITIWEILGGLIIVGSLLGMNQADQR